MPSFWQDISWAFFIRRSRKRGRIEGQPRNHCCQVLRILVRELRLVCLEEEGDEWIKDPESMYHDKMPRHWPTDPRVATVDHVVPFIIEDHHLKCPVPQVTACDPDVVNLFGHIPAIPSGMFALLTKEDPGGVEYPQAFVKARSQDADIRIAMRSLIPAGKQGYRMPAAENPAIEISQLLLQGGNWHRMPCSGFHGALAAGLERPARGLVKGKINPSAPSPRCS